MNRIKMLVAKKFFKELLPPVAEKDASGRSGGGAGRELASEFVKKVTYKENSDTDFEDPDLTLRTYRMVTILILISAKVSINMLTKSLRKGIAFLVQIQML